MQNIMKKTLFALSFAALLLSACEKENQNYESPAQQLDLTADYVVFDSDGGSSTVLVTSSASWDFSADGTWFTVVRDDDALKVSAEANSSSDNLHGSVTVTAGTLTASFSVAQLAAFTGTELSDGETANCYIAKTGNSYRFDATVKGNGLGVDFGGIAAYSESVGLTLDQDEIVYADLLWESTFDADQTRSRNIIDSDPIYRDGYVYFTTGSSEGNAVISVKDANGTVLWSWHIWVCDEEIPEIEGNGYYWQDRNLGAYSNVPGDINCRGLLYQWGRKDPFLPSSANFGDAEVDVFNYQTGDGSGQWNYSTYTAKTATTPPGNIEASVRNPMSIINFNGAIYTWYMTLSGDDNNLSYLWGDSEDLSTYVKSPFDPCPPGYYVPVQNPWISAKDADVNLWSVQGDGYGRYWTGGGNAFYPLTGAIFGTTGYISYTTTYGYYWTSGRTTPTFYSPDLMYFNVTNILTYSTNYPIHAFAVRCMRAE